MNIEPHKRPSARDVLRKMEQRDEEKEQLISNTPPLKPKGNVYFFCTLKEYWLRVNKDMLKDISACRHTL